MNLIHILKGTYRRAESRFMDLLLGVDERGVIRSQDIETNSPNKIHSRSVTSAQYRSIRVLLREAVERGWGGSHFYDIGSGVGRVCFFAENTGQFESVTGIEFSPALVKQSIAALGKRKITLLTADAAEYVITTRHNLIFMYHPFGAPVLEKFLRNNRKILKGSAIAYCNDVHRDVLEKHGMRLLWEDRKWSLSLWD